MQIGDTVSYLTQPLREEYATVLSIRDDGVSIDVETEDGVLKQVLIKALLEPPSPVDPTAPEMDSGAEPDEAMEPSETTDGDD